MQNQIEEILSGGYESPIKMVIGEVKTEIGNGVYKAVCQTGIRVDKEDLLRALQYDRGQYDKGFADGVRHGQQGWISVEERLPDPEVEVLIFAVRKYACKGEWWECPIITTAMYENGKVTTEESDWSWHDLDFAYDEENDCYYIPEGWWEYRHYNPEDVYNSAVDDKVLYWMPMPKPPKGE